MAMSSLVKLSFLIYPSLQWRTAGTSKLIVSTEIDCPLIYMLNSSSLVNMNQENTRIRLTEKDLISYNITTETNQYNTIPALRLLKCAFMQTVIFIASI